MISFLLSTPHRLFISRLSPEPLRLTHPVGVPLLFIVVTQGALRDPGLSRRATCRGKLSGRVTFRQLPRPSPEALGRATCHLGTLIPNPSSTLIPSPQSQIPSSLIQPIPQAEKASHIADPVSRARGEQRRSSDSHHRERRVFPGQIDRSGTGRIRGRSNRRTLRIPRIRKRACRHSDR